MQALLSSSRPRSASVRGADPRPRFAPPARVALVLDDAALGAALRTALLLRPELTETDPGGAEVVVRDAPAPVPEFGAGPRVLRIAGGPPAGLDETLLESADPAVILAAALLLARGHAVTAASRPARGAPAHLSARERQVTALLIEGASNKEIARRLDISVHTAKFHVTAVLEKLGARNRADAVAIALREGPVQL